MRAALPSPPGDRFRWFGLLLLLAAGPAAAAFGFEDVSRRAQELSRQPHRPPELKLPPELDTIKYDDYRAIRFLPSRALWRGGKLPFELQFFSPGFYFKHGVKINLLTPEGTKPVPFDPQGFSWGQLNLPPETLRALDYAGFRIHYPINQRAYKDEVGVFLGASYFRGVGHGQIYGISARGLAVDTALPGGEEVPFFREFWIEQPKPGAREIVVHALLDSRRLAGAYRFVIRPGVTTTMDVTLRLFLREPVGKLGLAPLSSMYFYGENHPAPAEDYRPEVHDSDGLQIAASNGEWIWRPVANPKRLLVTSFAQNDPRGFGLMQRDRMFAHYEDPEAHYHLRPSAWIEPKGNWGAGRIELVQIPSPDELNDNITSYWVPDVPPSPGAAFDLAYRLHWEMDRTTLPPTAHAVQTRRGLVDKDTYRFLVDFTGPALEALPADATVKADTWCGPGAELTGTQAFRVPETGHWRTVLTVKRTDKDQPVELRATLRGAKGPLSETWSYAWPIP